jgi:hypothetical protein
MPQFFLGGLFTAVRERFSDTFVRNNRADLGTAEDGSLWTTVRPGLGVTDNKASATNPTGYPISTVDMPSSNVTIDLQGVSQGAGAAIWVQSSDDWYAVTIDQTPRNVPETTEVVSANYSYGDRFTDAPGTAIAPFWSATFNSGSTTPGSWTNTWNYKETKWETATGNYGYTAWNTFFFKYSGAYFYKAAYFGIVSGWKTVTVVYYGWAKDGNSFTAYASYNYKQAYTVNKSQTNTFSYTTYNPPTFAGNAFAGNFTYAIIIPGYTYTAFAPYTYTVTVPASTVFDQKVSLRQSIAGNVQLLTSWLVSSAQVIRALKVRLTGNVISTKVYSDSNQVSQIGSDLVYTATGAEITPKFGLIISPSIYGQGTTAAGSVSISTQ